MRILAILLDSPSNGHSSTASRHNLIKHLWVSLQYTGCGGPKKLNNKYSFISYIKFLLFTIIKMKPKNLVCVDHYFPSIKLLRIYNNKSVFFFFFFFHPKKSILKNALQIKTYVNNISTNMYNATEVILLHHIVIQYIWITESPPGPS